MLMSFIGVQSDITELIRRKEAEKELQEAKVLLYSTPLLYVPSELLQEWGQEGAPGGQGTFSSILCM
jgi:hypothetical protein